MVRFAGNSVTQFNNILWTKAAIYFIVFISKIHEKNERFYWLAGWAEPGPDRINWEKSIHYLMVIARATRRCWIRHYIAVQLLKRFWKKAINFPTLFECTLHEIRTMFLFFFEFFSSIYRSCMSFSLIFCPFFYLFNLFSLLLIWIH